MSGMVVHSVPAWVRPSAVEVCDLQWLAYRRHLDTEGWVSQAAAAVAVAATVVWVWGGIGGPVTGRPEQPVTRAVATTELWAAMAACDGGYTPERQRRAVCAAEGVAYWAPDYQRVSLEEGYAIYQTLSWLLRSPDGWEHGRRAPLDIPSRGADGSPLPGDQRSAELVALVEDTRRRAADAVGTSS